MRKIMHGFLILGILTLSKGSYAFFCPNNFNNIEMSDTEDAVVAACGKPSSIKESERTVEPPKPQQLDYYVPSPVVGNTQFGGSMRVSIATDKNGRVVNISANGASLESTDLCGGHVRIGSSKQDVQKACGNPAFVNQSGNTGPSAAAPISVTRKEYVYDMDPPVTLVFEGGVLIDKR